MSVQRSFSRVENDLLPKFRENMGLAESTEDVRKFFGYTMAGLMEKVFEGRVPATYGDIRLAPGTPEGYALDDNLTGIPSFPRCGRPRTCPRSSAVSPRRRPTASAAWKKIPTRPRPRCTPPRTGWEKAGSPSSMRHNPGTVRRIAGTG